MESGGFNSWFGTNHDYRVDYGQTPLWSGFQQNERQRRGEEILAKLTPFRLADPPGFVEAERVIPITLLTGTEHSAVLDDVVSQLKEIARLLQSPLR